MRHAEPDRLSLALLGEPSSRPVRARNHSSTRSGGTTGNICAKIRPIVQGASFPRTVLLTVAVVFAAATILYSIIWMYAVRWETAVFLGVGYRDSASTWIPSITEVVEGSAAQHAGLLVDDQIVAVNNRSLGRRHRFYDAVWRRQPGEVVSLTVERPGEPAPLSYDATLGPAPALPGEARPLALTLLDQLTGSYPVLFVIVGLGVLFLRLEDRNAWLLALLFGGFVAAAPLLNVEAGIPPALRGFGVAYKVTFFGLTGPLFYYFFAVFPTSSPIDRRLPWLKQLLLGLGVTVSVPLALWVLLAGSFQPLLAVGVRIFETGFSFLPYGFIFGTIGLGFVSLVWNALRATSADARRKTRVIVFGTVVGVGPATVLQAAGAYLNRAPFDEFPYWIVTPCILAVFLLPLSVAYAVVRHRVLGIPQLLRLALQYAFARKLLLSVVPLLAGWLMLDLLLHADQPLIDVLRARGWAYGLLGGLALVTHTQRQRWLGALDRTFFRERYDARRLRARWSRRSARPPPSSRWRPGRLPGSRRRCMPSSWRSRCSTRTRPATAASRPRRPAGHRWRWPSTARWWCCCRYWASRSRCRCRGPAG